MMAMLIGRIQICEHYGMGKRLFYQFIEAKAPIVQIGSRFVTHTDEFDEWLRSRVKAKAAAEFGGQSIKK